MEFLSEVDGQIDLIVLHAARQRRTLPPVFRSIDGILGRVTLVRGAGIAKVTDLSLNDLVVELMLLLIFRVGTNQLTVQFRTIAVHTASSRGGNLASLGKIEVRWREFRSDRCYRGR